MKIVGGRWSNWSGSVSCRPDAIVAPRDEVELAAAVRKADGANLTLIALARRDGHAVFTGRQRLRDADRQGAAA